MENMLKGLRMHGPKALMALLVAAFAFVPAPGQSQRAFAKDIRLEVVNNTKATVSVQLCRMGDVSMAYQWGVKKNPCSATSQSASLNGGGGRVYFQANPIGVVVTGNGKTAYFYVSNPAVGKPYFEGNGDKVGMVEGELQTRHPSGMTIRYHRGGDTQTKIMLLEIVGI